MELFVGEETGSDTCLVCLEEISAKQAVWNCGVCFDMLHLGCVQSWIAKGAPTSGPLSKELFPAAFGAWTCPKCRSPYDGTPSRYLCYCGKLDLGKEQDQLDHFVAAHSCGEICGKPLSDCTHKCAIPCHRSACPQCTRTLMCACWCGRNKTLQRCGKAGYSCGSVCDKRLLCGHTCPQECHEGACAPCKLQSVRSCKCGALPNIAQPCEAGQLDCGRASCDGLLSCGFHKCDGKCHSPPCGACPLMGRRTCPCGSTQYSLKCDDKPPPKCSNACRKRMACGHVCPSLCHDGLCECSLAVSKTCRCGATKKQGVPCGAEFLCTGRCINDRPCGKHKCRRKCCAGDCGPCQEVCGGKLACGNHRCEAFCHKGPCQPCVRTVRIPCACGMTVLRVACGNETRVPAPKCKFVCSYQVCHHKPTHTCHFGPCPPCPTLCGKAADCGHVDPRPCHDPAYPIVPKVPEFKQGELFKTRKEENAEKQLVQSYGPRVRLALSDVQCEPCPVVVQRLCVGKHRLFDVVCSTNPVFACKAVCGAALQCSHHTCQLPCHVVEASGAACKQCVERCSFKYRLCDHQCPVLCHPATVPHPPCPVPVHVTCHCGRNVTTIKCFESSNAELVERVRHCGAPCPKDRPCGVHRCSKKCHDTVHDPCDAVCAKMMAVTCECRETKGQRMPCDEVMMLRKKKGLARESPAVLECSEVCAQRKAEKEAEVKRQQEEEDRLRDERRRLGRRSKQTDKGSGSTPAARAGRTGAEWTSQDVALAAAVGVVLLAAVVMIGNRLLLR